MTYKTDKGFKTISVSGQSDVVADANTDTLTLVAGSNVTLTTDASADSITIAASGGGSSSDTFNIDHFGRFRWSQNQIHGHHTYNENARYSYINTTLSGKATYSDGTINCPTFTATIVNSLLYIRSGIVPVNCTLDAFTVDGYWTTNLSDGNAKWSMWRAPAPSDGKDYSYEVTWTRVGSVTWAGTGTDDTYNKGSTTISSGNSYNAGDWFALTVQPGGSDVYTGSSTNNAFSMSSKWSVS
jgi:hypothetical protein